MIRIDALAGDEGLYRRRIEWYPNAREAFGAFLDSTAPRRGGGVLLPSFIGWSHREGSGVFDPVAERKLPHAFYRMDPRLHIDLQHLETTFERQDISILVLIHFFGYVDPSYLEAVDLARKHGALVLEDEAHALFTDLVGGLTGRAGDASIYSLHKLLPVPSGGALVVNARSTQLFEWGDDILSETPVQFGFDLNEMARQRVENALLLTELVRPLRGKIELLRPTLQPGEVPQTLPVVVRSVSRDLLYERMNRNIGGVVSLYHTLIKAIEPHLYPESYQLSRQIMNLPVHQDLGPDHMHALADELRSSIDALSASGAHGR